jgi:threonine dehydrogenase-like Zn-dependent dehydrogenase
VRRPCNHEDCSACRGGRQDYCYTGDYTERGIKGRHGYMAERAVVHSRYLVPVPAALREVGVLVEPLTIAEKALEQVRAAQSRLPWTTRHRPANGLDHDTHHNAVVLGAGPVGLLGAMALRARQYRTWVYSREPGDSPRADLVRAIGAEYLSAGDVPIEALPNAVGQIDLVYEATGAAAAAFQALAVLGTNGIFVFTGVPGRKSPIEIETGVVMKRIVLENQVLLGTVNAGRESFESAVRDLAVFQVQWPEALRALITGRHPVDEAPALVRDGGGGIKEVVTFATGR